MDILLDKKILQSLLKTNEISPLGMKNQPAEVGVKLCSIYWACSGAWCRDAQYIEHWLEKIGKCCHHHVWRSSTTAAKFLEHVLCRWMNVPKFWAQLSICTKCVGDIFGTTVHLHKIFLCDCPFVTNMLIKLMYFCQSGIEHLPHLQVPMLNILSDFLIGAQYIEHQPPVHWQPVLPGQAWHTLCRLLMANLGGILEFHMFQKRSMAGILR